MSDSGAERPADLPVLVGILNAVQQVRTRSLVAVSLAVAMLVGVGDYVAGGDVSFSVFYLLPVGVVASGAGARTGTRVAAVVASIWFTVEWIAGLADGPPVVVHIWNASVRFAVFTLVIALLEALRTSVAHERQLSREDSLSGIANSRSFYELAEHERRRGARSGGPITLAYLDIDDFKVINDEFGHSTGDAVIRSTAMSLRSALRDGDVVARLGGDEFAVLLPDTGPDDATVVLQRAHQALSANARHHGWAIGYSIGCVSFLAVPTTVDEMVSRGDAVMYEVKRSGKNAVRATVAGAGPGVSYLAAAHRSARG